MKIPRYFKAYELSSNESGNRITIDFGRLSEIWLYGEPDVEIGITKVMCYPIFPRNSRKAWILRSPGF